MTRSSLHRERSVPQTRTGGPRPVVPSTDVPLPGPGAQSLDLDELFIRLIEQCRRQYASPVVLGFNSRLTGGAKVDPREANALQFAVCEIISNAGRYAHPDGTPVEIVIECRSAAGGEILVDIGDDGVGLACDFAEWRDAGHGMAAIRAILQEIGAGLEVTTDDLGLRFQIVLHPLRRKCPGRGNFVWL